MKVAFDISQAGSSKAGCGYFAYSASRALVSCTSSVDYSFLRTFGTSWWDTDNVSLVVPGAEHLPYYATFEDHSSTIQFWSSNPENIYLNIGMPDIIHSNNFYMPENKVGARIVYTLYDMTVFDFPQFASDANRRYCVAQTMRAAAEADFIVAISHSTLEAFDKYFRIDPRRTMVIDLGARPRGSRIPIRPQNLRFTGSYILSVGTIEPRKNYDATIIALSRLKDKADINLVIAGKLGWDMSHLVNIVESLGLTERVQFLNYVPEEELEWLYSNAAAFVYPSHAEGFGLPVLEAMAAGCPVICSSSTSLPEVAGDSALYVDPLDIESLCRAILNIFLSRSLQSKLSAAGLSRSNHYSWDKTALQLQAAYSQALDLPPRGYTNTIGG